MCQLNNNVALSLCAGALVASMQANAARYADIGELEEVSMTVEINETDNDAEIVMAFEADDGIDKLVVKDPHGHRILRLRSRDGESIGLSEILLESAEPSVAGVLAAYPEGTYLVRARTVSGAVLLGEAHLSHALLPAPDFVPANGTMVPLGDVTVAWGAVNGAAGYVVEVEQDDLNVNLTVRVAGDRTSFTVPGDFLLADTAYEIAVGVIAGNGNLSVAESEFLTASE